VTVKPPASILLLVELSYKINQREKEVRGKVEGRVLEIGMFFLEINGEADRAVNLFHE
jgi:hypothetical protein